MSFRGRFLSIALSNLPQLRYGRLAVSIQQKRCKHKFKAINDNLNRSSDEYLGTFKKNKDLETGYLQTLGLINQGDKKGIARHLKQGKLLARDRISRLVDNIDEFIELSPTAGLGMPYGDVPAAGVITGLGMVNGKYVMIIANDGSFKGGTVFPITLKKQLRAQQIAEELSVPCVYIVDSGGAFLPLQAEIFINGGKTFYNEAVMSSNGIPQVAVVCGMCTAGGAYIPTMADEAIMVHKTGSIFLAGPPLVKAALGEVISAEELGGATMHSTVSGCIDHFAKDEVESYEICRDVIGSLNLPTPTFPSDYNDPLYDSDELNGLVSSLNPNAHQVISRLVDDSGFQEFKSLYGTSIVTGFSYICGLPVGIIANSSHTLCSDGCVKASHFVQLCGQRGLPIVFLTNQSDGGDAVYSSAGDALKQHAKFMSAVACSDVPKVTIVTGNFHGTSAYAMGSKAFGSNVLFNWPSSSIGLYSLKGMKDILVSQSHENLDELYEKIVQKYNAMHAASNVWTDGIILPSQTRKVLANVLKVFTYSAKMKDYTEAYKRGMQANYRM